MVDKDFVYGNYVAKTRENEAVKIDEDWYNVRTNIQGFLKNFKKGDKVKYKFNQEGTKKTIFLLYKVKQDEVPEKVEKPKVEEPAKEEKPKEKKEEPKTETGKEKGKPDQKYWDKRNESIKRQAYAKVAAMAISTLGTVDDIETLGQMITSLTEQLVEWENKQ